MEPQRTCVGCRATAAKSSLVRLVWDPVVGAVAVDRAQRLVGRGCYLHPGCVDVAVRRRAVGRGLRVGVDPAQVAAALADVRSD